MGYDTITVRRVAGSLGAEVDGVDLSQPLDDRRIERRTLHHGLSDAFPRRRRVRRCTVDGDRPS